MFNRMNASTLANLYSWHKKIIYRIPSSFVSSKDIRITPLFKEALYLSSPSLHHKVFIQNSVQHEYPLSLLKYYNRSLYRCTPFGLFAGIGVSEWNEHTRILLQGRSRHTQLDTHYIYGLSRYFSSLPDLQEHLHFYTNTSLYKIGNSFRYIEYNINENKRRYSVATTEVTDTLQALVNFCRQPQSYHIILEHLQYQSYSVEEVRAYLNALIDRQILTSTLEPPVIADVPPLTHITKELEAANTSQAKKIIKKLSDIASALSTIDIQEDNAAETYQPIIELLKQVGASVNESKIFHVVAKHNFHSNTVDKSWQQPLLEAATLLISLGSSTKHSSMLNFIQRYRMRYGEQPIPLLEALDTDSGLGYPDNIGKKYSPLLKNLPQPTGEETSFTIVWSQPEKYLWNTLQEALFQRQSVVEISDQNKRSDSTVKYNDLPASMSLMFRMVQDDKIYLEHVGGATGTSLLGRFAHSDTLVKDIVQEIADAEQSFNPDAILADIAHLPEDLHGNVVTRPSFYNYTISYLSNPSTTKQIPVQDLYISIKGDQILLFSRKLQHYVIPRLSVAHNHAKSELPVYRFLCDLQNYGLKTGLGFCWSVLDHQFKFLPRAEYKSVILYPATWHLSKDDFALLIKKDVEDVDQRIALFKKQWRLPDQFVLADSDQELFVDLTKSWLVKVFIHTIRRREHITLKEFFYPSDAVTDTEGNIYANQMVATLIKQAPTYQCPKILDIAQTLTRNFIPGSEWLYYKIYCGTHVADQIIAEAISAFVQELLEQQLIDQWFFVRYADPESHLRLRFRCAKKISASKIIFLVKEKLTIFQKTDIVWKVQLDSYEREIERYGADTMELVEAVFYHDSVAVAALLSNYEDTDFEDTRWVKAIKLVHDLLTCFSLSSVQKQELMENLRNDFAHEFKQDKQQKRHIDKLYRAHRNTITCALSNDESHSVFTPEEQLIFEQRLAQIQPIATQMLSVCSRPSSIVSANHLLSSLIHMTCNRIFADAQRKHELVLYDFLFRHYRSQVARYSQ